MVPSTCDEILVLGFDYGLLEPAAAEQARAAAESIRETIRHTLKNVIAIGRNLQGVKAALAHGQFGAWLRAEFSWTERTAQNFMNVAEQFGANAKALSDLPIQPTAAYLLAAPSAPEAARRAALAMAERGETVTMALAKELIAQVRRQSGRRQVEQLSADKLAARLEAVLERFKQRCQPDGMGVLAERLMEFARTLKSSSDGAPSADESGELGGGPEAAN